MNRKNTRYNWHAMPMHLHCGHQTGASIASHMHNARELGMRYIRITPHDNRTGPMRYPVREFDFTRGALVLEEETGGVCGWETVGEPGLSFDGDGLVMQAGNDGLCGILLFASGKRQSVSLLADVCLYLTLEYELPEDARLLLDAQLSQRPPDHEPAHLIYVLGGSVPEEGIDGMHTAYRIPERDGDGRYVLALTRDVPESLGGLDNAFVTLRVLLQTPGGKGSCRLRRFAMETSVGFDPVIRRQREVAERVGERYGIKPFVTTEISTAGHHKNCLSTCVPVIDYAARGYNVTQNEAVAHVRAHGGIFSYNHPFVKTDTTVMTPEEISREVEKYAAEFIACRLWGADVMEVGFPEGRYGFDLQRHLQLWDLLSLAGVFVTGDGDSDSHDSRKSWWDGNNFATWTAAEAEYDFPVPEEAFIRSLQAGRAYMGDPVYLKGDVTFTCEGCPMGAVIPVAQRDLRPRRMHFAAEAVQPGWELRIVADAQVVQKIPVEAERIEVDFDLVPERVVSFARAELYQGSGRCVLLTNPIYLVRQDEYAGELPAARIYI